MNQTMKSSYEVERGAYFSFGGVNCAVKNHKHLVISFASQTLIDAVHDEGPFVAFASRKIRQLYLLTLIVQRPIGIVFQV